MSGVHLHKLSDQAEREDKCYTLHGAEAVKAGGDDPASSLVSRNITVMGKRTSVRLEPEMWMALREIAEREACSIHDLCTLVFLRKNRKTSLTAAIRVFIMLYFRAASSEDGHRRAGHGSFSRMMERARIPETAGRFLKAEKKRSSFTR